MGPYLFRGQIILFSSGSSEVSQVPISSLILYGFGASVDQSLLGYSMFLESLRLIIFFEKSSGNCNGYTEPTTAEEQTFSSGDNEPKYSVTLAGSRWM